MRSEATTVDDYLATLPDERRHALEVVRRTILERLPPGYEEVMDWGVISYVVPLDTYPNTYNGKPLCYVALASQKHHMAVYLTGVYADEGSREEFLAAYRASGKKLDMGKSCVRFKRLDDVPLDVIGDAVAGFAVDEFVAAQEETRAKPRSPRG